jgi:Cu(I)/Ag(I) efflux system membrane protein CusA/SilA
LATPIDAIPDLSDNQVIVFTDWPGRSPQEAEDQVTYPLVTNLQGLAGVRVVRASSAFSFSMVNVIFEDDVELYWARTRVLERLNLVAAQLPEGVTPTLGPDATGVGQVFWYTLESDRHSLRDLRTLQDWFVRYRLNSVPGVAEVASVGGYVQQYQVDVDPNRLRAYKLPLSVVVEAVERSNTNVGGNVVEQAGQWAVVRGIGLIESTADVENIVLGAQNGTPVYVKNVAEVKLGNAFRTGALDRDGKEAVGGVVIARYGVNTLAVIEAVKRRLKELEPGLPAGVRVVPFYDRTQLIERATGTLKRAFIEELLLVTLAHIIFLAHFRSILIVTIPLPLAVLVSFLFMKYMGISSNLMSLSGIAIAIGVLVDAGIVVTENAFRFIEQRGIDPQDRPAVRGAVLDSTRLVGRPVFFSMAIIILAFVPVFALTGQEGKLFHPLAFTKTFAMVGATIIAVTLVPVLCTILLGGKFHAEQSNPVMRLLGGKGAGLADMTRAGLPVPPGFIVTTEACNAYYTDGKNFPEGMWEQVIDGLRAVEAKTGKKFGDPENPLLVSVRSGAPSSMPGMMDTVLNLGLNEQTVQGLATQTGDLRFSLDAYRRFATLFAEIVMGVAHEKFGNSSTRSRAMS